MERWHRYACQTEEGMDNTAVSEAAKALAADGEKLAGLLTSIQESLTQMQTFTENASAYVTAVRENIGAAQNDLSLVNLSDMEAAANAAAKEQAGGALDAGACIDSR